MSANVNNRAKLKWWGRHGWNLYRKFYHKFPAIYVSENERTSWIMKLLHSCTPPAAITSSRTDSKILLAVVLRLFLGDA